MVASVLPIYPSDHIEVAPGFTLITEELNPISERGSDAVILDTPDDFLLASLGDARLRVLEPIRITLEPENDDIIAEAREFNEFGFGGTRSDAIRDLQRALVELYFSLTVDEGRLGSELTATLKGLRRKLILRS